MASYCRLRNKHMGSSGREAPSLAAFATTIDLLWKSRQYRDRASIRMTAEGALFFKNWDWVDERRYRFHLYITRGPESAWQTLHFTSTYRAVLRSELRRILEQAGFTNVRWLSPSDSGFYQPIFIARRDG